jgi:CheY-like chemotaxis protein
LGTGRRLLLADDSITIQKVVNLTFADEGMEVVTVGNGDLAIEKIEDLSPDIVLADIHMPGLNGYEVCEFVKRNARFRHIPVMLLVGSFEPYDEAEARRVGADDYLTKPFQSIRQLVSKVGSLLGGKSAADDDSPTKDLAHPAEAHSESESEAAQQPLSPAAPLNQQLWAGMEDRGEAPRSDAFTDPSLDDAMIEATPAVEYNMHRTASSQQRPTTPLSATDLEEAGINFNQTSPERNFNQTSPINMQETLRMPEPEQEGQNIFEESMGQTENSYTASSTSSSSRLANAAAADDALLDLGEMDAPRSTAEADDFILDIWDDAPAQATTSAATASAPAVETIEAPQIVDEEDAVEAPAAVAEFVEAEVIEAEPVLEAEPLVEEPRAQEEEATAAAPVMAEPQTGQITLAQLSPEVIDAIARRAVEQLSEKVVEQIAWEVVPQLAELMIKRRLEEEKKQ